MNIRVSEISKKEYSDNIQLLVGNLPLWLQPQFIDCYKNKRILIARAGNEIKAIWVVPFIKEKGLELAKREFRFFPYTSPFLTDHDNLKKRKVVFKLFEYLSSKCDSITLPAHPDFKDLPIIQNMGAFIEWRHTHVLDHSVRLSEISSRLRNHIKYSQKNIKIAESYSPRDFNFDIAIKGGDVEMQQRKKLAFKLLKHGQAIIFSAKYNDHTCAGVMLAHDDDWAYLLHSWQLEKVPRGTISHLIYKAVNWTFDVKKLKFFDFEGSVICSVDNFFHGFNAKIIPYGYIHWSLDQNKLHQLIEKSRNISGRLI